MPHKEGINDNVQRWIVSICKYIAGGIVSTSLNECYHLSLLIQAHGLGDFDPDVNW